MADYVPVLPAFSFLEQIQDIASFLVDHQSSTTFPEEKKSEFVKSIQPLLVSGGGEDETEGEDEGKKEKTEAGLSEEKKVEAVKILVQAVVDSKGALEGREQDIESSHLILLNLLSTTFPSPSSTSSSTEYLESFESIIGAVKAGVENACKAGGGKKRGAEAGLRVLSNAYNSLPPSSPSRPTTLLTLLSLLPLISPTSLSSLGLTITQIETCLNQWESLDVQAKKEWLSQVAELYDPASPSTKGDNENQQEQEEADDKIQKIEFALNLRLVSLHLSSSSSATSIPEITLALTTLLRLPTAFDLTPVLSIQGVREQVMGDERLKGLVRLFEEDVELSEGLEWVKGQESWLSENGISSALLVKKLRLLALTSLCAKSTNKEVGYEAIAEVLQVDESEVESWVIDAILLKLLTGRLSQPTRQLRIQSTISRSFTSTEWTLLSKRLGDWKKTLDEVKGVVDEALAMGQRGGQQGGDGERRERRQQGGGGQKREHQQQQQQQQQVPVVAA